MTLADFTGAMERIVAGLEKKNRLLNPHEREVVAYHEMGHALVAMSLPGTDTVHKVSIIPRGIGALGYTIQRPTEDRFLMTREELDNRMAVLLGGRAAEHIVFGEVSTGAADDLAKVTDIARSMVTRYGMTEELGQVVYEKNPHSFLGGEMPQMPYTERSYSEATAARDRRRGQGDRRRGIPPDGGPAAGAARHARTRRAPAARARNPRRGRPCRVAQRAGGAPGRMPAVLGPAWLHAGGARPMIDASTATDSDFEKISKPS